MSLWHEYGGAQHIFGDSFKRTRGAKLFCLGASLREKSSIEYLVGGDQFQFVVQLQRYQFQISCPGGSGSIAPNWQRYQATSITPDDCSGHSTSSRLNHTDSTIKSTYYWAHGASLAKIVTL